MGHIPAHMQIRSDLGAHSRMRRASTPMLVLVGALIGLAVSSVAIFCGIVH